jgi:hypothetical protein
MIKNEHIVYGYGERVDGQGKMLIIGLTPQGLDYLRDNITTPDGEGSTLTVDPPGNMTFNVKNVLVIHCKDKETIRQILIMAGNPVPEIQ